jgi:hypothetical protein
MEKNTFEILEAVLKGDRTITQANRKKFLRYLTEPAPVPNNDPRIYSRCEAAKLLGNKTPRYVDQLCRRGLLQKFTPRGNKRSIGVLGESLHQFIEGTPSD